MTLMEFTSQRVIYSPECYEVTVLLVGLYVSKFVYEDKTSRKSHFGQEKAKLITNFWSGGGNEHRDFRRTF